MNRKARNGLISNPHILIGFTLLLSLLLITTQSLATSDEVADDEAHNALFLEQRMPAASTCLNCHPRQYEQWSKSQHAYAQLSPVFNSMQATVLKLTNGTNGDFCIRCHTAVGMNLGEPLFGPNLERHATSREGITCITCHRMSQPLGKISGRLPINQGDMTQPVYGPSGNENLAKTLETPGLKITTQANERGRKIHGEVKKFSFLSESGFCGVCHDVTLVDGFRLEEAFSEYKSSPAAARGESCQDCHMGKTPGVVSGYDVGPAAVVNGYETADRKLTNHRFPGPDHSIVHPGMFPHNPAAQELASLDEWITFDHKKGWGTDEFEDEVTDDMEFPDRWSDIDDRYEGREILDVQFEALDEMAEARKAILKVGYLLEDIIVDEVSEDNIEFKIKVKNGTDGHNVPTGFTGERLVWLHVVVQDRRGKVIFKSGDLDPNGDVRDLHSRYVHNGELPLDTQLFSLQSKFITQNVRGGEREQILAVNFSPDPLPFLRPDSRPTILDGRILGARIHKQGLISNGSRWAKYEVDSKALNGNGPYKVTVELKAAMVPVNLIGAIAGVGFDYGLSPREIADAVVEGHVVLWKKEQSLVVKNEGDNQ
jgi:nitrate/TMAO reductase-like tetraheme cytochrome c subunit